MENSIDAAFCRVCADSLTLWESPHCSKCGQIFETGSSNHICGLCLRTPPKFDHLSAAFLYGGAIKDAIARFKYIPSPWLAPPLGALMTNSFKSHPLPDLVIPIPMHTKKRIQRGFNQAALLGAIGAAQLKRPYWPQGLIRKTPAPAQASMNREQRMTSMKNAFRVNPRYSVKGKSILLVDDVVTTTATVRAASRILAQNGADKISVICLARSV